MLRNAVLVAALRRLIHIPDPGFRFGQHSREEALAWMKGDPVFSLRARLGLRAGAGEKKSGYGQEARARARLEYSFEMFPE